MVKRNRPEVHAQDVQFEWFAAYVGVACIAAGIIGPIFAFLAYINVLIMTMLFMLLGLAASAGYLVIIWKYTALEIGIRFTFSIVPIFYILFSAVMVFALIKKPARDGWVTAFRALAILIVQRPATLVISSVTSLVWAISVLFSLYMLHSISIRCTGAEFIAFFIFIALSLIWNERLITYIGYTTNCGTYASWYVVNGSADAERMPRATLKAFLRSVTVSLGSLALASLLLALSFVLRGILKGVFGKCGKKCGEKLTEKIQEYLNDYALVYIATAGLSLFAASAAAKKAVKTPSALSGGVEVIPLFVAFSFGMTCSCVTLCLTRFVYLAHSSLYNTTLMFFFSSIPIVIIGWFSLRTSLAPFHSALISLEACHAESPQMLEVASKPIHNLIGKRIGVPKAVPAKTTAAAKKTTTAKTAAAKKTAAGAKKVAATAKTTSAAAAKPTAAKPKVVTSVAPAPSTAAPVVAPAPIDPPAPIDLESSSMDPPAEY